MSEQKKPEAGEFWEWAGCRLRIVGTRTNGAVIAEHECGHLEFGCTSDEMKYLPDCDSFEWQPDTFPQWFVSGPRNLWINTVCIRMDTRNYGYRIQHDGEELPFPVEDDHIAEMIAEKHWQKATESEALSRVKTGEPTGTEAAVCADIAARQRLGVAKYGKTVADNPLTLKEWLQHAYEECLDQAVYLRRAIDETQNTLPR